MSDTFFSLSFILCVAQRTHCYYYFAHFSYTIKGVTVYSLVCGVQVVTNMNEQIEGWREGSTDLFFYEPLY